MRLPRAFSTATMNAMSHPDYAAEMLPDVVPRWHVIEVYPGAERKVASALVARRFGIYIPEMDETVIVRGCAVDRTELMFPGYIFAFVWDVMAHRTRIEAIDGGVRVMLDANGEPLHLSDAEIDLIRAIENGARPIRLEEFQVEVDAPLSSRKKKQRRRTKRIVITVTDEIVRTRAGGWVRGDFDDTINAALLSLDLPGRNQTLMRALGLG